MNQRAWIVTAVILGMFGLWMATHKSPALPVVEDVTSVATSAEKKEAAGLEKSEDSDSKKETPGATASLDVQGNFLEALSGVQACFGFANPVQGSEGDVSLEAWKGALRSELGEVVLEAEDWTNTHLVLPNGEKRRIRIESEMGDDNRITKKLKYSSVDADDLPVPLVLPEEQATEPSETFIASLEKEGQVTLTEKAQRLYYSDGSEIMTVQRNNAVSEVEITRGGKSYHCWNLDQSGHQCDCL